jgi:exonuclease SbcD
MKLIHTSDWHLGQKLMGFSREKEHEEFMNWLYNKIIEREIDVLIISGDIFDSMTPPTSAITNYYNFLEKISRIEHLKQTIIIGGNHDSASLLTSSKKILDRLKIKIVADGDNLEDEIILIPNIGVVCAIPFLKDGVLKKFVSDENLKDRKDSIINGIKKHYTETYEMAKKIAGDLPIVATGHLTTSNILKGDGERDIYIGNLDGVSPEIFPPFHYIALGHIHKFQSVSENIIYCGSPIPITFREAKYEKYIVFKDLQKDIFEQIEVPKFKELVSISTNFENLQNEFSKIEKNSFVEIEISDDYGSLIEEKIENLAKLYSLNILSRKFKGSRENSALLEEEKKIPVFLKDLQPEEIFLRKIDGIAENREELILSFREVLEEAIVS